jgi:hypothetical protein
MRRTARWKGRTGADPPVGEGASERQKHQAAMARQGVNRLGSALDRFDTFLAECLVCFKNPA